MLAHNSRCHAPGDASGGPQSRCQRGGHAGLDKARLPAKPVPRSSFAGLC